MLNRLAKWLRLLGADVLTEPTLGGSELLALAREQSRIVLTRDKRLRLAHDVLFIESNFFRDQIVQVLRKYPFDLTERAFTRCSECNSVLKRVGRELVARRVPPFVFASHEEFALCEGCGRVYWDATHVERAMKEIRELLNQSRVFEAND